MLDEIRKNALKALNFKDNAEILAQISALRKCECECEFGDVVRIKSENVSENFKAQIRQTALNLRPWRKGPFEIFGTFIDSEWQSFMKFNLLRTKMALENKIVADVGCNNGYYLFKMLSQRPKMLVGFDPSVRTFLQFKFLDKFISSGIKYELLGVEHLGIYEHKFDTIFCLGVLYHRSDPIKCLKMLKNALNPGGEVFLDTMYLDMDGDFCLSPKERYSKIPNIYFIPTISALQNWCERAKFAKFEIIATKETDLNEQRKTEWIFGESLGEFLDANDRSKTVEGYPAPKRVYVKVGI